MSLPAEARVAHGLAHRTGGGVHQVGGELIELRPGQGQIQVLGPVASAVI